MMDGLAKKGFGHVCRKDSHVFFLIDKDFLASNYDKLGLKFNDIASAMAKPSTLPREFEYLLGKTILVQISDLKSRSSKLWLDSS